MLPKIHVSSWVYKIAAMLLKCLGVVANPRAFGAWIRLSAELLAHPPLAVSGRLFGWPTLVLHWVGEGEVGGHRTAGPGRQDRQPTLSLQHCVCLLWLLASQVTLPTTQLTKAANVGVCNGAKEQGWWGQTTYPTFLAHRCTGGSGSPASRWRGIPPPHTHTHVLATQWDRTAAPPKGQALEQVCEWSWCNSFLLAVA